MRNNHRASPRQSGGGETPPVRRLPKELRPTGRMLAAAIEAVGTYSASDWPFYLLTCRTLAETENAGVLAPTARARLFQTAGAMLAGWGLTPQSRGRVEPVKDERTTAQRILDAVDGVRR